MYTLAERGCKIKIYKINLKRKQKIGRGGFGKYYKLYGSKGVKVLNVYQNSYKDSESLKQSQSWKEAKHEYELLRLAIKSQHSPVPYGIAIVRDGSKYYPGIVMQHIDGKLLAHLSCNNHKEIDNKYNGNLREFLENKMKSVGINHTDIHKRNIIINKNNKRIKPYVIDFSPSLASSSNLQPS